jgi:putative (di)nucleoside polyphosphate hydrolase
LGDKNKQGASVNMEDEELLLAEYKHFSESFWKNEEIGERRVNFFITLTTAIIAGIVALVTSGHADLSAVEVRQIATVALFGTFLFGLITFLRMLQRNHVTDEYKKIINYVREQLRRRSASLAEYSLPFQSHKKRLFRGGLAETVAVMNSLILAAIAALWSGKGYGWIAVPVAFLVSFVPQALTARNRGREKESCSQTFRAGVGAVIADRRGKVLALERRDVPGAWQLPQGGLEAGEDQLEAVMREILEETGIKESDLRLLPTEPRLLAYELPKEYRSKKTGRGQVQYWFLFCYNGPDEAITLGDKEEFKDWKWVSMDELVSSVVSFRKSVYQELAEDFSRQLQDYYT